MFVLELLLVLGLVVVVPLALPLGEVVELALPLGEVLIVELLPVAAPVLGVPGVPTAPVPVSGHSQVPVAALAPTDALPLMPAPARAVGEVLTAALPLGEVVVPAAALPPGETLLVVPAVASGHAHKPA